MKSKKRALIVGRFQPFHLGHLYLIREALKLADTIIIAIGSSNVTDINNPIDYSARKKMLLQVLKKEGLQDKVAKIIPSPDFPDDKKWVEELIKHTGDFEIVVGNNNWTNNCLKKLGYKVKEIPYLNRNLYQGKNVREKHKKGEKWEVAVPNYLVKNIQKRLSTDRNHASS